MPTDPLSQTATAEERFLHYARTGDTVTIQALIREFADRSFNQARRIIGRDDGAEDAVQDAYLRLVKSAKKYDGSVPFAAWMGRLVNLSALNYRERQRSRHTNLSDMSDQGVAAMNDSHTTAQPAESRELEAIRSALDLLPERYRAPLTLHYFGGLDQSETAQALGMPPETLRTRLARGLEQLRGKLGRAGFAVSSAGLIAIFSSQPSYAASPALISSLTATRRLVAMGQNAGGQALGSKLGVKIAALAGSAAIKSAVVGALAVVAAVTLLTPARIMPSAVATTDPVQSPFGGIAWAIPGTIEAENYDVGGEGVAYHDIDDFNTERDYRDDGVDVVGDPAHESSDFSGGGGPFIGWTQAGEWLEYTVHVAKAGVYTLEARVSSRDDRGNGVFHVEFDGVDKTGPMTVPPAVSETIWQTVSRTGISLRPGTQVMRVSFDRLGIAEMDFEEVANLNFIRLTPAGAQQ
jgi:RNA polymerase sigma factor (sigma-70 family)